MTNLADVPALLGLSDDDAFGDILANDVAIRNYLDPIKRHMQSVPGANEVWINRPCELVIKARGVVKVIHEPMLTYAALDALAQAVAVYAQQTIDAAHPLLSATLPDGERIQIVMPPAVEPGLIVIAIRVHGETILSLDQYEHDGVLDRFLWGLPHDLDARKQLLQGEDRELITLLQARQLKQFLIQAVRAEKTIAVVGDTGSGKTTLMKSMCQYIPRHERLLTIEDVRELLLPAHDNRAHMLYSKGGLSVAKIDPRDLIATCMRLSPDRVLLAELRGSEAWDFLKLLTTGHRGSITSFHAESCALAIERFMFMAKENSEAASLSRDELKHLVRLTVDIVIHITARDVYDDAGKSVGVDRFIDEIHFDPLQKLSARFGDREILGAEPVA
jgi:type IV secretion system protein VirB11